MGPREIGAEDRGTAEPQLVCRTGAPLLHSIGCPGVMLWRQAAQVAAYFAVMVMMVSCAPDDSQRRVNWRRACRVDEESMTW